MAPPNVNVDERAQCRREHSRFFLYPSNIFNYDEGFDDVLQALILPAFNGMDVSLQNTMDIVASMPCIGFKSFVSGSLLGYMHPFFKLTANFVTICAATSTPRAIIL
jgi:hypothetical protein